MSFTGTLRSPKEIEPDQIARGIALSDLEGTENSSLHCSTRSDRGNPAPEPPANAILRRSRVRRARRRRSGVATPAARTATSPDRRAGPAARCGRAARPAPRRRGKRRLAVDHHLAGGIGSKVVSTRTGGAPVRSWRRSPRARPRCRGRAPARYGEAAARTGRRQHRDRRGRDQRRERRHRPVTLNTGGRCDGGPHRRTTSRAAGGGPPQRPLDRSWRRRRQALIAGPRQLSSQPSRTTARASYRRARPCTRPRGSCPRGSSSELDLADHDRLDPDQGPRSRIRAAYFSSGSQPASNRLVSRRSGARAAR